MYRIAILFNDEKTITVDADKESLEKILEAIKKGEAFIDSRNGKGLWVDSANVRLVHFETIAEAVSEKPSTPETIDCEMLDPEAIEYPTDKSQWEQIEAPYGRKKDGTPRRRPGRQKARV